MDQNATLPSPVDPTTSTSAPVSDAPTSVPDPSNDQATAVPAADYASSSVPAPGAPVSDNSSTTEDESPNPAAVFAPPVSSTPESPTVVAPDLNHITPEKPDQQAASSQDVMMEVAKKISESQNVLVALSSDPSVDEMATAIGLSLFLDKLGKRATAIYSGSTPNALEFLKPEETFEPSVDTLQDFVIALNKEKADHLRYKLDGDFVKIFITPYKTRIGKNDLEFSYGDFNVDLVLALNVANGVDLDTALREHGRIMHDATVVNITTGDPGKFGETEWSDKTASSVSEMIARLLYGVGSKVEIEGPEATAFLTGIISATNRFSNDKTTPETMQIASRLMESGADQQVISKNITPDTNDKVYSLLGNDMPKQDNDPTKLDIEHNTEEKSEDAIEEAKEEINEAEKIVDATADQDPALLDDLKAAEASLTEASDKTIPDTSNQPVKLEDNPTDTAALEAELSDGPLLGEQLPDVNSGQFTNEPDSDMKTEYSLPTVTPLTINSGENDVESLEQNNLDLEQNNSINTEDRQEKVIQPSEDILSASSEEGSEKYGKMLEDAISNLGESTSTPTAESQASPNPVENPASAMTPQTASTPEINGVPEINYMPLPGEEVLPPPPTPPIDMDSATAATPMEQPTTSEPTPEPASADMSAAEPTMPEPTSTAIPTAEPVQTEETPTSLGSQPAMQDQVYAPQAADPSAFKIPGM